MVGWGVGVDDREQENDRERERGGKKSMELNPD